MAIMDEFDPKKDGWFFENWREGTTALSWELFRRTYLGINPTEDPIEAPLDVAFYQIFKSCAANGNCGGMCMLGLALFKYGGYMGYCSPANFYAGVMGPTRADLHETINVMQGRQFSASGIRNFLDVVKAGQLNDGEAAFARIQSGLASGNYAMLSLSNGVAGDAAHVVIPYRAEEPTPGTKVLHVWDPNRPFDAFPAYYNDEHNTITITSPTMWSYDQTVGGTLTGTLYDGSMGGWCFAIPISLELHKGRHPISVGFIMTGPTVLFVSGLGSAVTQIEDDSGRRFYSSNRSHRLLTDIETSSTRRLDGVARWPWYGAGKDGELPGELFILQRPPDSPALTFTVRGSQYSLAHARAGSLIEIEARSSGAARDKVRIEPVAGHAHSLELHTDAAKRTFDIHQLRADAEGGWRSVQVRNALVSKADLRVEPVGGLDGVEVSSLKEKKEFDLEFRQYRSKKLTSHDAGRHKVAAGKAVRLSPADWATLAHTTVDRTQRSR